MARPLTSAMATEIQKALLRPFWLVELDFPSAPVRRTSRSVDVVFGGGTYLGNGDLLSVGPIEETVDVEATGVGITLAARPSLVTTVLTDYYQGRPAKVYLGLVDDAGAVVADPELVGAGAMEGAQVHDDDAAPTIVLSVETALRDLGLPKERRWNSEDQKLVFPGDTGFRYVEVLEKIIRAGDL